MNFPKTFHTQKIREKEKKHKSDIWGNSQFPAPIECSIVSSRQFASDKTQLQSHFCLFELFFSSQQTRTRQTASNLINGSSALANISIKKKLCIMILREETQTNYELLNFPPSPHRHCRRRCSLQHLAGATRKNIWIMLPNVEKKAIYFFFRQPR